MLYINFNVNFSEDGRFTVMSDEGRGGIWRLKSKGQEFLERGLHQELAIKSLNGADTDRLSVVRDVENEKIYLILTTNGEIPLYLAVNRGQSRNKPNVVNSISKIKHRDYGLLCLISAKVGDVIQAALPSGEDEVYWVKGKNEIVVTSIVPGLGEFDKPKWQPLFVAE